MIEDNDSLLREYRERLAERTGVTVCLAVICEAVRRLKLRPRKTRFERPEIAAKCEAYRQQMSDVPASRLVFLDESGITTMLARTHARAHAGGGRMGRSRSAPASA